MYKLAEALNNRTYRSALKEYEKQLEEHVLTCQNLARTFVSEILKAIADDNNQEYILVLSWYNYSFGTLATTLANQLVKKALPVFPEAPVKPVDPNADPKNDSSLLQAPVHSASWKYIQEAMKNAEIPFRKLALSACEPVFYINLQGIILKEDVKDAVELDDDPNAVDITEFI